MAANQTSGPNVLKVRRRTPTNTVVAAGSLLSEGTPGPRDSIVAWQTALETQNEELRIALQVLQQQSHRDVDFYDTCPVGFVSLNADGDIIRTNPNGAALLNRDQRGLA